MMLAISAPWLASSALILLQLVDSIAVAPSCHTEEHEHVPFMILASLHALHKQLYPFIQADSVPCLTASFNSISAPLAINSSTGRCIHPHMPSPMPSSWPKKKSIGVEQGVKRLGKGGNAAKRQVRCNTRADPPHSPQSQTDFSMQRRFNRQCNPQISLFVRIQGPYSTTCTRM
jgi:hypothetical protein